MSYEEDCRLASLIRMADGGLSCRKENDCIMRAWQIKSYGGPEVFELNEIPDPQPKEGWVLIDIKAFGLNRSELYTRQGHSGDAVTLPRVLGIECVGVVVDGGVSGHRDRRHGSCHPLARGWPADPAAGHDRDHGCAHGHRALSVSEDGLLPESGIDATRAPCLQGAANPWRA